MRTSLALLAPLVLWLLSAIVGCGAVRQNIHVQRDVEHLPALTRVDPFSLAVPEGVEIPEQSRDAFDSKFQEELSRRGLIGAIGAEGTLEARPTVLSYEVEGGADSSFVETQGHAVVKLEVLLSDRDGKRVASFRATERSEVIGAVPKFASPTVMRGAAEALAGELDAAIERGSKELRERSEPSSEETE